MGILDGFTELRRETTTTFSPAEAFAAVVLATVSIDGYVSDAEVRNVASVLNRMQLYRSYPSEVLQRLFERLGLAIQRQGFKVILDAAIEALPHHLHATVFAVVTDLVLADGEISSEEDTLLNYLWSELNVDQHTAETIIQVMIIKNRG